MAVFDCDLASSVKTAGFAKQFLTFFPGGIQEHNTPRSRSYFYPWPSLFLCRLCVFGVDETYNQHRLNDINETSLKLICTHNGLDVGEDGKTHQCIDYVESCRISSDIKSFSRRTLIRPTGSFVHIQNAWEFPRRHGPIYESNPS